MPQTGPPASTALDGTHAAHTNHNPRLVPIHVRVPEDLMRRLHAARNRIRLSPDQGRTPEDYYHGGISAIVRLLLTMGLDTFERGVSPRKGKTR